jgi:hypothetical protein
MEAPPPLRGILVLEARAVRRIRLPVMHRGYVHKLQGEEGRTMLVGILIVALLYAQVTGRLG